MTNDIPVSSVMRQSRTSVNLRMPEQNSINVFTIICPSTCCGSYTPQLHVYYMYPSVSMLLKRLPLCEVTHTDDKMPLVHRNNYCKWIIRHT